MATEAGPPPIQGTIIDPPPKPVPGYAQKLDRHHVGGVAYRTFKRYGYTKVGLLAGGTAYYLFLSLLSLLAFAYGIIAIVGADQLSEALTEALTEAFPGLIGSEGIDPATLRSTGTTAGIIGLILMLYSSLRAVAGAASSMHLIYGAPPDPRNYVAARVRYLVVLLAVAPLVVLSFLALGATTTLVSPVLSAIGVEGELATAMVTLAGLLVGFGIDVATLWILLGVLGGIRPQRRPRLIAALLGALAALLIKQLLSRIVEWSLDKPEYGAFAIPLAILFVLSLLSTVLYASGCLAAAITNRDVPLHAYQAGHPDAGQGGADDGHGAADGPGAPQRHSGAGPVRA